MSDEPIRKLIEEIEKLRGHIRNSKAKVKRRIKKLEKIFDPMERHRIEFEIELLKRKIRRSEIVEAKLSIPVIKATANPEDEIDWSKAGRA